ncbi:MULTISPECIES: PAS domain S-box protein [unclassified Paenibacillus]|uniref:PAS domain S-box protein n=1 Tax=unclassified Paenibacillus TaxID=185978 RepID=UPI001AE405DB|nr:MULTISPECIES: PAS domain S-box protein [unclassified Paenibacillus]MBP1157244.1 two-component system sporulation sensor kinase A [Paenibacillus sp. PvP091]MBP1172017.1 two-component system sporulation sensor kinase A [Paenibacillus sp. PvR098]MBP2438398.1 two-component system sporulation sensor kinase A [Paenibacillus sp. PvP052]
MANDNLINHPLFLLSFHHSPTGMALVASSGRCLAANKALYGLLGYSEPELTGRMMVDLCHPDSLDHMSDFWNSLHLLSDESAIHRAELNWLHREGYHVPLSITASKYIGEQNSSEAYYILYLNRFEVNHSLQSERGDFSREHGNSLNSLKQDRGCQQLYELIAVNSQDIITYCDLDGVILYTSPAVYHQLGYQAEELVGKSSCDLIHPEDLLQIQSAYDNEDSDEKIHICRALHKQGHYIWMESSVKLVRDPNGQVSNILTVGRDISTRKQSEEALLKSEEKYRMLIEEMPEALLIQQDGKWVCVNEMAVKLLGAADRSDLLYKPINDFIDPDVLEAAYNLSDTIRNGAFVPTFKGKFMKVQGESVEVEFSAVPTWYENQFAVRIIAKDISEARKAQELLQNSEKLSLVGQLAAGIAHEIRNPLTAVKGFIQLLKSGVADKQLYYDIISSEISRIEQILGEMLMLAKPKAVQFMPVDIHRLLAHVTTLIESQAVMNSIEIDKECEQGLPFIDGDENQLKQVFINLMKNAIEAMPSGGKLTVRANKKGENRIVVRVIDQGTGIPADQLERIGHPFFTTKEHGTGLGMMVSFQIIESHGGQVSISSEIGQGTTIEIVLPVSVNGGKP